MTDIKKLMAQINKEHGTNAIVTGNHIVEMSHAPITTGSLSLDLALQGGLPVGRLVIYSGEFSSGKSFMAYKAIVSFQNKYKKEVATKEGTRWVVCDKEKGAEPLTCALIESEAMTYDSVWAKAIGIDEDKLLLIRPKSMEEALKIAEAMQRAGVDLIVHDSYTAYTPEKILSVEVGDTVQMGIKPKLLQDYHNRVDSINNGAVREGRLPTTVIAISQLREKIGVTYGDPTYLPGGKTMLYAPTIEVRFRSADKIMSDTKEAIGYEIKFTIKKQKSSSGRNRTGDFDIYTDEGGLVTKGSIDQGKEIVNEAIMYSVIEQRGSWYYYKGDQVAQGKEGTYKKLREEPELYARVKADLFTIINDKGSK